MFMQWLFAICYLNWLFITIIGVQVFGKMEFNRPSAKIFRNDVKLHRIPNYEWLTTEIIVENRIFDDMKINTPKTYAATRIINDFFFIILYELVIIKYLWLTFAETHIRMNWEFCYKYINLHKKMIYFFTVWERVNLHIG